MTTWQQQHLKLPVPWASVDHALFQARVWREYAMTFVDPKFRTMTGVDNAWVREFMKVDRAYCVARVRDAVLAARDINATGRCDYAVGERAVDMEKCCVCGQWCRVEAMLCPTWHPKDSEKLCCSEDCCWGYGRS